jgi:hypothetical protein
MEINFQKYQLKVGLSHLETRPILCLVKNTVTVLHDYVTKLITGCSG